MPIAWPHLAGLFAEFKKKAVEKAVKVLHDPPAAAQTGKSSSVPDNDQLDSLRAQLEKAEASAKKFEVRLTDSGRNQYSDKDSKDSDSERPLAPKKDDKPKASAKRASADADASA